jgi:hypothetical protein
MPMSQRSAVAWSRGRVWLIVCYMKESGTGLH